MNHHRSHHLSICIVAFWIALFGLGTAQDAPAVGSPREQVSTVTVPPDINRVSERPWWWKPTHKPPVATTVTITGNVLFDVDSAMLTPSATSQLGSVLDLARGYADRRLVIEGYTDSDGEPSRNQTLSEARASSVAQWLIQQGIDANRLSVVGHGASDPVAQNDTPEHKVLNRRVVVRLQPVSS